MVSRKTMELENNKEVVCEMYGWNTIAIQPVGSGSFTLQCKLFPDSDWKECFMVNMRTGNMVNTAVTDDIYVGGIDAVYSFRVVNNGFTKLVARIS